LPTGDLRRFFLASVFFFLVNFLVFLFEPHHWAINKPHRTTMPKVRTKRNHPPPGFDVIEPTLLDLERRMRDGALALLCYPTPFPEAPPNSCT
jgi:hypothetical protein